MYISLYIIHIIKDISFIQFIPTLETKDAVVVQMRFYEFTMETFSAILPIPNQSVVELQNFSESKVKTKNMA